MDFKAEYRLCLNDEVLPFSEELLTFIDPLDLAQDIDLNLDEHRGRVKVVSLKATGNLRWLEKILKVSAQFMKTNLNKFALIKDIKKAVEDVKKTTKKPRAPTQWKSLVFLRIRDRNLFVQNRSDCVIVGLVGVTGKTSPEDEKETLQWIAEQMYKDLEFVQEQGSDEPAGGWKRSESWGDHENEITEVVENLKKHSQCLKATWVPSRQCFRVQNLRKVFKDICICLGKRRKSSVDLQDTFASAESRALEFLMDSDPPSASSAPAIQDQENEELAP